MFTKGGIDMARLGALRKSCLVLAWLGLDVACGRISSRAQRLDDASTEAESGASGRDASRLDGSRPPREASTRDGPVLDAALDGGGAYTLGSGTGVRAVSDHAGNALVQWTSMDGTHFARWNAMKHAWSIAAPVSDGLMGLVDTNGSGYPIWLSSSNTPLDGTTSSTAVRRFDSQSESWGGIHLIPGPQANAYGGAFGIDGEGTAFAIWPSAASYNTASAFWSPASAGWQSIPDVPYIWRVVSKQGAGAFAWDESFGFSVRSFEPGTGSWSAATTVQPPSAFAVHYLVVGPNGEALAMTYVVGATDRQFLVNRYDPTASQWGSSETAFDVPGLADASTYYGPMTGVTDIQHQDFVACPVQTPDAGFETPVARRDPSGGWSISRILPGYDPSFALSEDKAGNVFGFRYPTLIAYSSSTGRWVDTTVAGGSYDFATLPTGAFAVGFNNGWLTAYHLAGDGSAWAPATGLPSDTRLTIGNAYYVVVPIEPDGALVAWTGPLGVRAAFLH